MAVKLKKIGTNIHLTDSKDKPIVEFNLYGKAEQKQYSGKNLYPHKVIVYNNYGVVVTNNDDGTFNASGTATIDLNLIQKGFSLPIGVYKIVKKEESANLYTRLYNQTKKEWVIKNLTTSFQTFEITDNADVLDIRLQIGNGNTVNVAEQAIMICSSTETDSTYEPYVGGMPSPSPDYPQDIEVSGESYNLLENTAESQTVNGVTFTVNEDKSITVKGTATDLAYINVGSYTFDEKVILSGCPSGGSANTYSLYAYGTSLLGRDIGSGAEIQANEQADIRLMVASGVTIDKTFYPMIRKASVQNDRYMPYGVGSVEVKSCGKNQYDNISKFTSLNYAGAVISRASEDTFNATGTTTSFINVLQKPFSLPKGRYILSTKKQDSVMHIHLYNQTKTAFMARDINVQEKEVEIVDATDVLDFRFQADSGTVLNITGQAIMIRLASDTDSTYQPYTETTSTIPTQNGLCGIKVSSGGNYTDENGQQWITDEIVKYADGSGKSIQRIGHKTVSREVTFVLANQNDNGVYTFRSPSDWLSDRQNTSSTKAMCTHAMYGANLNSGSLIYEADAECMYFIYSTTYNTVYFNTRKATTVEEFYALFDGAEVYYPLAEPIITDLTAEEIAEIEKLHTFYAVTNISNDAECGMAVTYISTLLEFLQPKTDWTSSSRFDIEDYNRIKNNLSYLYDVSLSRVGTFDIEDMGEDLTVDLDENKDWDVNVFNAFENNLHTINSRVTSKDIGSKKTFHENGVFPDYAELNRIESATLMNKTALENLSAGLRRIPFKFGRFKSRL